MKIENTFSLPSGEEVKDFLLKWTPRAIAMGFGGYYGLGIAYEIGLMAKIDGIAIPILKYYVGYAGLGALMPTFQWYAAWSVRFVFGLGFGLLYDLCEKVVRECSRMVSNYWHRVFT